MIFLWLLIIQIKLDHSLTKIKTEKAMKAIICEYHSHFYFYVLVEAMLREKFQAAHDMMM